MRKGVAILLSSSITFKLIAEEGNKEGRYIIVKRNIRNIRPRRNLLNYTSKKRRKNTL